MKLIVGLNQLFADYSNTRGGVISGGWRWFLFWFFG